MPKLRSRLLGSTYPGCVTQLTRKAAIPSPLYQRSDPREGRLPPRVRTTGRPPYGHHQSTRLAYLRARKGAYSLTARSCPFCHVLVIVFLLGRRIQTIGCRFESLMWGELHRKEDPYRRPLQLA